MIIKVNELVPIPPLISVEVTLTPLQARLYEIGNWNITVAQALATKLSLDSVKRVKYEKELVAFFSGLKGIKDKLPTL